MTYYKKIIAIALLSASAVAGLLLVNSAADTNEINGESEFKEHCASCHAGGGNIIRADKTLSSKDREEYGIKTSIDIVSLIRKPGEGMTAFDEKTISDQEAKAIADYIITTFE